MRKTTAKFAAATIILLIILTSCAPFGTSKAERVLRFETHLNESREYLYQNFLEAQTDDYAVIRDSDAVYTWDYWFPLVFPNTGTYTITITSDSDDSLQGTVDGPELFSGPKTIQFHLIRSGVYWYLEGLTLDGTKIID